MNSLLWKNITLIQELISFDDKDFASICEMREGLFKKYKKAQEFLPLDAAINLSENFNVSLESLCFHEIDISSAVSYFTGNFTNLPYRYSYASHSKHRTIINLMDYVQRFLGPQYKILLLREFQIYDDFFKDPNGKINLHFIHDLCKLLEQKKVPDKFFEDMGAHSFFTNSGTELGRKLASFKTLEDMYSAIADGLSEKFDENYKYQIRSIHGNELIFREYLRPEVEEELQNFKGTGTSAVTHTKLGVLSSFPCYLGLSQAKVSITNCEHNGDKFSQYRIILPIDGTKPQQICYS